MNSYSEAYKILLIVLLNTGTKQEGRNGNTIVIPHYSFTLDFSTGIDSAKLKLRKMFYRGIEGEFLTITDEKTPLTNVKQFEDNG